MVVENVVVCRVYVEFSGIGEWCTVHSFVLSVSMGGVHSWSGMHMTCEM